MAKILCATRGGEASVRAQDAVIALAQEQNHIILFLYASDIDFLKHVSHGARMDVVQNEMDHMGSFLLAIACERAEKAGVEAQPVLAHGKLLDSIVEVADDDAEIELIVLGRPAEESVYEPSSIRRLVDKIQEITGVTTRILP
ncbi:MAG: universal stress protein [Chloroflexota bacterium]